MSIDIEDEEHELTTRCRICDRALAQGMNVIVLERGVLGPQSFVSLEDPFYFCGWSCLECYCCDAFDEAVRIEGEEND